MSERQALPLRKMRRMYHPQGRRHSTSAKGRGGGGRWGAEEMPQPGLGSLRPILCEQPPEGKGEKHATLWGLILKPKQKDLFFQVLGHLLIYANLKLSSGEVNSTDLPLHKRPQKSVQDETNRVLKE